MEVISHFIKEEIEQLVWGVLVSNSLGFSSNLSKQAIKVILGEELGNIS